MATHVGEVPDETGKDLADYLRNRTGAALGDRRYRALAIDAADSSPEGVTSMSSGPVS